MKKLVLALAALLALASPALGQGTPGSATVVAACGTPPSTYTAGQNRPVLQNTNGQTCSAATNTPSGTQHVDGTGTAGTPAGGVLSVQGVSGGTPIPATTTPGQRTIVPLDVATVTTGGTAVTALIAGHRTAGGFLYNPIGASINLCINEQATASGTTSAAGLTCIQPGQAYTLTPSAAAVSVITSDSTHPFSGQGLN